MKVYFALLLAALFTSCGREDDHETKIDPELQPHVDLYLSYAPDNGHLDELLSVKFVPAWLLQGSLGRCEKENETVLGKKSTTRTVLIADTTNACLYGVVVAHELAHCLHDREHIGESPRELMGSTTFLNCEFWSENLNAQLEALFP